MSIGTTSRSCCGSTCPQTAASFAREEPYSPKGLIENRADAVPFGGAQAVAREENGLTELIRNLIPQPSPRPSCPSDFPADMAGGRPGRISGEQCHTLENQGWRFVSYRYTIPRPVFGSA